MKRLSMPFSFAVPCILGIAALSLGPACGDDDGQPPPVDAGIDSGPDAGGSTFTVTAYDVLGSGAKDTPLAGATVAFDPPFSDRIEAVTDASGLVTFELDPWDWATGTASVTVHKAGYTLMSRVNMTLEEIEEEGGNIDTVLMALPSTVSTSEVTGSATGMIDPEDNYLLVMPNVEGSTWSQDVGPSFQVTVPRGEPFQMTALEFAYPGSAATSARGFSQDLLCYCEAEVGAVQEPTAQLSINLGVDQVASLTVDGSWVLPTDPDSVIRSTGRIHAYIGDGTSGSSFGWTEFVDLLPDGNTFDYTLRYFLHSGVQEPRTTWVVIGAGDDQSLVWVDGLPAAGQLQETFLEFPSWMEPQNPSVVTSLFAPKMWETNNPGVPGLESWVVILRGDQELWFISAGPTESWARVPAPPSSVDYAAEFEGVLLSGQLRVGIADESGVFFARMATTRAARLSP